MKRFVHRSSRRRLARRAAAGLSMVELLIVLAIIVCISAVAIPSVIHTISNVRTRLIMSDLSGIFQRCRSEAIRQNKAMTVHLGSSGGQTIAYVKDSTSTAARTGADPQFALGHGVNFVASGAGAPSALDATTLWGSSADAPPPDSTHDTSFNSRGLPCHYDATVSPPCQAEGFVYYFSYQPPLGTNGWTAISISPAGRITTWMWDGGAWKN